MGIEANSSNMRFYQKLRSVPQEAVKTIRGGRLNGFSDINPMWRIKALTEMFGPCGVGWWYEITDKRIERDAETGQSAAFMDILLYYRDPATLEASHGIPGTGGSSFVTKEKNGFYVSDECFKMALTDAISVAAKAIGVAADIYYSKDRSKYSNASEPESDKEPEYEPPQDLSKTPVMSVELLCEDCGKEIFGYTHKGRDISAEKQASGAYKKFGRYICLDCVKKIEAENG